jgi:hypothetical protein
MPGTDTHALTLRLDPKLVARLDRAAKQYEERQMAAGFPDRVYSRSQVMRLALQMGLDAIEAKLKTSKGGSR